MTENQYNDLVNKYNELGRKFTESSNKYRRECSKNEYFVKEHNRQVGLIQELNRRLEVSQEMHKNQIEQHNEAVRKMSEALKFQDLASKSDKLHEVLQLKSSQIENLKKRLDKDEEELETLRAKMDIKNIYAEAAEKDESWENIE